MLEMSSDAAKELSANFCHFPEGFSVYKRKSLLGILKENYTNNEIIQHYYNYFYSVYNKLPVEKILEAIEYIRDKHQLGEEIISSISFVLHPDKTMTVTCKNNDLDFTFKFKSESTISSESYSRALAFGYAYKEAEGELLHWLKFFENRISKIDTLRHALIKKTKSGEEEHHDR